MLSVDKLFEHLDIAVHPFALCCAEADKRITLGPRDETTIHYVLAGQGALSFSGFSPFEVLAGTMVIAPSGATHELQGTGDSSQLPDTVRQCRPLDVGLIELGERMSELHGGIAMACGSVDATYRGLNGIFDFLPTPIMVHSSPGDVIWQSFESIVREMTNPQPGSAAMLKALFQQCFIELLRQHSKSVQCELPWLAALEKPRLNKAIEQIIDDPGRPYTLESLAKMCNMSRTSFASKFAQSFGRSAMDFVKEVRLRYAARMLNGTEEPVKTIAAKVGYESRSHFSHAFRDLFGVSPAEYRATQE